MAHLGQPRALSIPNRYESLQWDDVLVTHAPDPQGPPTVLLITLNRPAKYNAFTGPMMASIIRACELADVDDRVKCLVFTGAGRMFCAGADLDIGLSQQKHETAVSHRDGGGLAALAIHRCRKPSIAAMNGSAVGVGMTMTLPMSIRIAAREAKCGFVFSRRGIIMEACSSFFLPRLIGYSRALHLTTTGSVLPAGSPLFGDLFSEVVPASEVLARAMELAVEIAANTSVVSSYVMKELMWRNPGSAEATHLLDSRCIYDMFGAPDKKEGVDAFLQKRQVNFTGSVVNDLPAAMPWWEKTDTSVWNEASTSKSKL